LRVLERREVKPVGSNQHTKVDVRVIAATNRNLCAEVNEKRFRPDLYYRLAVVEVRLPPLRERIEDLPLLVEQILASLGSSMHPQAHTLRTPEFMSDLARHAWPGNVRELRNYLERCLTLSERAPLVASEAAADALPVDVSIPLREARERWTAVLERRYLRDLLARHEDNVTRAARSAGIDRIHLYRLLWKHGLR
jgi:transcriptional regulator with PAS, ATPase and Fis domain